MDASMLAGVALFNDIAVPHVSYYRPPVKFNCRDGFLGIGPQCLPLDRVGPLHELVLQVHINGELRQTVALADLFRPAAPLLADVSAFMTLQPGDVLLLGTSCLTTPGQEGTRPRARVGDTVTVSAPGFAPLVNTFVAEGAA
jgi:5-oxopent-3-ene-1,2,5-tricarboxylate decarboxylase/2-hydroxyhepta-2,4-diene-1,7-dioate isomerase